MSREDQVKVSLTLNGEDWGTWDTFSGGAVESEETKYRPGGMAPQVSLGGATTVTNITIARLYEALRDHGNVHRLMQLAGKATAVVKKQPLDVDGNPFGRPLTYTGKLMNVTPPDHDSESSDAARIELEISTDGSVA